MVPFLHENRARGHVESLVSQPHLFFFFPLNFKIGIESLYNVVFVSAIQYNESAICVAGRGTPFRAQRWALV